MPAVAVLGPLQVRTPGGEPVAIPARKHADLLVILAAERTTRSAGYLCELLWRGRPPDSALVTLQGYISRLRRTLAPVESVRIETEGAGYVLRCTGPATDLDLLDVWSRRARAAYADGDLETVVDALDPALRLWRGDALTDVVDIAELEPERARLDEVRSELTEMYATAQLTLGRPGAAIPTLTAAHARNPLQESTVRLLALAMRDSGRTSEALEALRRLRRDLADHVGLDPAPETVRVEQEIRQSDTPIRIGQSALVGRADAIAALDRAWRDSTRGLTVVEVRGPGGIGKTALIDDVLRRHGATAYYASGTGDGAPLQTLSTWLDQAAIDGRHLDDDPTPRTLARLLADGARESGHLVAVIDDVHRADRDSLRIVAAALRALRSYPILVLLGARSESVPDFDGAGTKVRIDLQPLPVDSVDDLVRAELGDRWRDSWPAVIERSRGNPFLAHQLCDLVRGGRPLTESNLLRAKLVTVPPSARSLAQVLAVAGDRTPAALWVADDADLAELVDAGVVAVADGAVSFVHELVRDGVLDDIGALRRAELHGLVADAMAEHTPEDLGPIARHRIAAASGAVDQRVATACIAAARQALARGADLDAAELATAGMRLTPPGGDEFVDLARLAGRAQHRLGDYFAADESFTRAGRVDAEQRNWDGLARTALAASPRGAGGFFTGYGVVVSGSSTLRTQALAHRTDLNADVRAELAAAEAASRAIHGLSDVPSLLADARARSGPGTDSWWQVRLAEFVCGWEPTTIDDRVKIADELTEMAGSEPDARATALHLRRVCALEAGDMRLVRRLSAEFTRVAAEGGADLVTMQLWWDVMIAVMRGDYDRSHALMAGFTARATDPASRLLAEASMLTSSSIEMWHRGRLGEALGEADRMAEDFDPDFALVVAMAAAELGDHDRALRTIESLIALPGRLSGPKVGVRVPLLIEALLAVGQSAPEHREDVARLTASIEPYTEGWRDQLVVQWPGLVCLGPAGLYRGTARAMLGLPGARGQVNAARHRARELGTRPYEDRAAQRLSRWPFESR